MNNDEQTDDSGGEIQVAKGPLLTSCPCDQMMSAEGAGSLSLSSPDTRKSRCSVAAEVAERWHGHRGAAGWSEGLCAQRSVSRGLCRASTAVLRPADAIPSPVISSAAMISPQCRLLHKDSHNLEAIRLLGICYLCREGNIYEDNDPKHTSSLCKGYLTKKESDGVLRQMTWPPQTPDLNPIEMVWGELDRRVKAKGPTSAKHLWELLQDCWKIISSDYLLKLIKRMPRVCKAVIKAKVP
ncbi:uncharacterized protein LOC143769817 isoform X1 [Ranitomeya variabilis]|uniref:uncharacterized protein LOC143769817 isoform X1 n=1 Tax=Ranitomeya variabilis TaxID=490064 RepID=UPI0040569A44